MHELSIVSSLYEIMEKKALEMEAKAITRVKLQVGILSGVLPEFLETAFELFKKDTMAAEASLEIVKVPLTIKCRSCGSEKTAGELVFVCEQCGCFDVDILAGKELILETLELSF